MESLSVGKPRGELQDGAGRPVYREIDTLREERVRPVGARLAAVRAWARRHWFICAFAAAVGGFNLLFPNRYYYNDSVRYALAVERGSWEGLFHHAHVLGNWYFYAVYQALAGLALPTRAIYVAQTMNVLGAVAVIGVFYAALTKVVRRSVAAFATVFFASTFSFQFTSTQGEVYILPLLTYMVIVWILLRNSFRPSWGTLAAVAALAALAVQCHSMYVVAIVPLAFAIGIRRDRRALTQAVTLCLVVGTVTAVGYYAAAYAAGFRGWRAVISWWGVYTHDDSFGYISWATPFNFLKGWVATLVYVGFWKGTLSGYATTWGQIWSVFSALALTLTFLAGVSTARGVNLKVLKQYPAPYIGFFGSTALLFTVFTAWWDPGEVEFLVVALIPIIFLAAFVWDRAERRWLPRVIAVSALLAIMAVNFIGYATWYTDLRRNDIYTFASYCSHDPPDGSSVVISTEINWWIEAYLEYFFADELAQRQINLRTVKKDPDILANELSRSSNVYLYVNDDRNPFRDVGPNCYGRYRLRHEEIRAYMVPLRGN